MNTHIHGGRFDYYGIQWYELSGTSHPTITVNGKTYSGINVAVDMGENYVVDNFSIKFNFYGGHFRKGILLTRKTTNDDWNLLYEIDNSGVSGLVTQQYNITNEADKRAGRYYSLWITEGPSNEGL